MMAGAIFVVCDVGTPWPETVEAPLLPPPRSRRVGRAPAQRPRVLAGVGGGRILMIGGLRSSLATDASCSTVLMLRLDIVARDWTRLSFGSCRPLGPMISQIWKPIGAALYRCTDPAFHVGWGHYIYDLTIQGIVLQPVWTQTFWTSIWTNILQSFIKSKLERGGWTMLRTRTRQAYAGMELYQIHRLSYNLVLLS
ncbi:hypothetical protein OPV22_024706 [Ensete ventricosum]|uniref:Uncharacterized protein n=1 Tax=Ensete ventricosum TaxID=4639 RepID=A0AAV8QHL8_ENSVE|nr:hypothetical protein OPV22_024706 [Ensete ventricosum]